VDQTVSSLQSGGNFEGKEVRFGQAASALFVVITTDASCGAVNTLHDSLMPIAGIIPMLNIQLGEVIFGGGCRPVRDVDVRDSGGVYRWPDGRPYTGASGCNLRH
jgi:K+-transporting ATPase A subunit